MNNITTIFFDAGGVLFDTETSRETRIKNILKSKGYREEEIIKAIRCGEDFYKKLKDYKWLSKWKDEEDFFNQYYEIITQNLPTNDPYSLKMQLFLHTHFAGHCVLFKEVRAILDSLYGKYKLGVISNAFPSMDWIFDLLDIRKYFDVIVLSSKVGKSKPDSVIYEKALESINSKAAECIFIDDKQENIEAANNLGFVGIHLDRKNDDLNIIKPYLILNCKSNYVIKEGD
jgi:putative hydrolase of the HAD superfamily